MAHLSSLLHASRGRFAHGSLGRRTASVVGVGALVAAAIVGAAGIASAGAVTGDDSRASVVQGNINACPVGSALLVDGGTTTTTQNGITVTVTQTSADTPNPFPAGGVVTLPKGTDVLTVSLPAGKTLTGDIYVKGGDGYNDYPDSALTSLIPPVNTGGNIAGLSHFLICGSLAAAPGQLTVSKVVAGSPAPAAGTTFPITVVCGGATTPMSLADGGSQTVSNIAAGTTCSVTESDSKGASTVTYTTSAGSGPAAPTVTIASGQTSTVTVTNTYTAAPAAATGELTVTKVVAGSPAPAAGTAFPITVVCGGTTTPMSLADGGSQTVKNIAAGTTCSVTESDSKGASSVTYTTSAGSGPAAPTVTIASGQTSTVTVTNTYTATTPPAPGSGTLTVRKTVTGGGTGSSGPFTITVNCGGAGTQTYTNVINGTSESANYPDGTHCTVTETDAKGAKTTTYTVGSGAASTTAPTVTVNSGSTITVTVANSFPTDPLRVVKAVDKTTAAYGDQLTYTLTVISGAGADPQNVVVTDQVPDGTTFVSANCASPCTVGPPVGGLVTWNVGGMHASSSVSVTFTVHITPLPDGASPTAETITNTGAVSSLGDPGGPSNTVTTDVPAVLGETFTQPPSTTTTTTAATPSTVVAATSTSALPFTGLPANQLLAFAGLCLVSGAALLLIGRRRDALGDD